MFQILKIKRIFHIPKCYDTPSWKYPFCYDRGVKKYPQCYDEIPFLL